MPYFMKSGGPFMWLLMILALVNLFLIVRSAIRLFGGNATEAPKAAQGLHAILFWGTISALLGILGQLSGIYKALNVIMRASEISPNAIAMGFAESLTTTITGLLILFFSAIAWFALQARYRQVVEG